GIPMMKACGLPLVLTCQATGDPPESRPRTTSMPAAAPVPPWAAAGSGGPNGPADWGAGGVVSLGTDAVAESVSSAAVRPEAGLRSSEGLDPWAGCSAVGGASGSGCLSAGSGALSRPRLLESGGAAAAAPVGSGETIDVSGACLGTARVVSPI